ncbi:MAG: DUF3573 domain-containing protein [Francisellaceae bacterium]
MLKKLSIAVALAATVTSTAFADDTNYDASVARSDIQHQIDDLKVQLKSLEKQNDELNKKVTQGLTVPTTKGEIQNFLYSDMHEGIVPFAMMSSSQLAYSLLKQRDKFSDQALIFGGFVEADAQTWNGSKIETSTLVNANKESEGYKYFPTSGKNIYLTSAKLYMSANLGKYVTAYTYLSGDQDNAPDISKAAVIFGNLSVSPFYVTVGKLTVPVGTYGGGGPWTSSLSDAYFNISTQSNVSVAYSNADNGVSTNVTWFQVDDHSSSFSTALFYKGTLGELNYGANVGYIYNIAGKLLGLENDDGRVGEFNTDLNLNYDIYGLGLGWSTTTNSSATTNNGKAGAWYISADAAPTIWGRSTDFSLAYNGAYNTNDVGDVVALSGAAMPGYATNSGVQKQIIAGISRPVFSDNVLLGLEYAYQYLYNKQHANTYTLDLSVFF